MGETESESDSQSVVQDGPQMDVASIAREAYVKIAAEMLGNIGHHVSEVYLEEILAKMDNPPPQKAGALSGTIYERSSNSMVAKIRTALSHGLSHCTSYIGFLFD